MNPTNIEKKAKIKYWLEVSGMSRKELCEKLHVSENALNGWLATKDIPPGRWLEIKEFFEAMLNPPKKPEKVRAVASVFTEEQMASMAEAMKLMGDVQPDEFVHIACMKLIAETLKKD